MNFGAAIHALKDGKKVAREGWNGKGMWIVLMPALQLPPHSTQEPGAKVNDRTAKHIGLDTPLDSQPYVAMWTAAQQWQPGWLPSQADMLAEDWTTVGESGDSRWDAAIKNARFMLEEYKQIPVGVFGAIGIAQTIDRYDRGERTPELLSDLEAIQ